MTTAVITGASRGLGLAIAHDLARRPPAHPADDTPATPRVHSGWHLILTARGREQLTAAAAALDGLARVTTVVGDVADPQHRAAVAQAVGGAPLDLLVNNASDLGPSPLPALAEVDPVRLLQLLGTNAVAPLALTQLLLPALGAAGGTVVNVSSDAAVEAWPGWGAYGSSKAALDQLTAVLAAEQPALSVYALDPGDMRTDMHQAAFPGEDISDRPDPATVAPAVWLLLNTRPPGGRYRASELLSPATAAAGTGARA